MRRMAEEKLHMPVPSDPKLAQGRTGDNDDDRWAAVVRRGRRAGVLSGYRWAVERKRGLLDREAAA
jgi:hypothetical protein